MAYVTAVLALVAGGRRSDARALASFIPDCLVLVKRLLRAPRVPRRRKLLLVAYLVMPIDLVPDLIPVAGQLDDAMLVALVLRAVLRSGGEDLLQEQQERAAPNTRTRPPLDVRAARPASVSRVDSRRM